MRSAVELRAEARRLTETVKNLSSTELKKNWLPGRCI